MVRTLISLDEDDKRWLDRQAKEGHTTMTEVVRQAIRSYRLRGRPSKGQKPTYKEILEMTKGTWTQGDALEYVRKIRAEE